jgi:hypothetical protein
VIRVFVNAAPVDVEPGADVRDALRACDPTLEASVISGAAYVTDARGIEIPLDVRLAAGAILRVVVSARKRSESDDVDA